MAQEHRHRRKKLSASEVEEIKKLYKTGRFSFYELGRRFNVSGTWVRQIIVEGRRDGKVSN